MRKPHLSSKFLAGLLTLILTLSTPYFPSSSEINSNQNTIAPFTGVPLVQALSLNQILQEDGIQITTEVNEKYGEILTPDALRFVAALQRKFNKKRKRLLKERDALQILWDAGDFGEFLEETRGIREGDWVANDPNDLPSQPVPAEMQYRPVEITGPAQDPKMVINALNSAVVDEYDDEGKPTGKKVPGSTQFMADFEDSNGQLFEKSRLQGQLNLKRANERTLTFHDKRRNKDYKLNDNLATLLVRAGGLHLEEKHILIDGEPVSASIFDFAMYLYHNHKALKENGTAPYYYLPKLESYKEARWWNNVITEAEKDLGIPVGTIKVTVLLETLPQSFQVEEIIYELRNHMAGINAGRWDYIFSYIKKLRNHPDRVLPDRKEVGMNVRFMKTYVLNLIRACHKRGVHAMGGMSAFIPAKDEETNKTAFAKVKQDKIQEFVERGHDGTWIAHPGLASLARKIADESFGDKPNQKDRQYTYTEVLSLLAEEGDEWFVEGKEYSAEEYEEIVAKLLIEPSKGDITEEGVRVNASVGIEYLANFMVGRGAVAINNLMEDLATAEISRSQLWQWLRHSVDTKEGDTITTAYLERIFNEELAKLADKYPKNKFYLQVAKELFVLMVIDKEMANFIPDFTYDSLDNLQALLDTAENGEPLVDPIAAAKLEEEWVTHPRWKGIERPYSATKVLLLRAMIRKGNTLGANQSEKLFNILQKMAGKGEAVRALSAYDGVAAEQNAKAGLKAIYYSGWQEAATQNRWPDQSIYAYDSVPNSVRKINEHLQKLAGIYETKGLKEIDWMLPIIADGEAGFGGTLNVFQLMTWMIEAGAAAVHFEDQVGAEKKCGHLGGKVLVPSNQFEMTLSTARLASDVNIKKGGVGTLIIARTDADSAKLVSSDSDPRDKDLMIGIIPTQSDAADAGIFEKIKNVISNGDNFWQKLNGIFGEIKKLLPGVDGSTYDRVMAFYGKNPIEDSAEAEARGIVSYARAKEMGLEHLWQPVREPQKGYYVTIGGVKGSIARAIRYAPYSDLIWMETSHPDLDEAREFIQGVRGYSPDGGKTFPFKDQLFAYNNSPSFNWREKFYAKFPKEDSESPEAYEARIDRELKDFMIELAKMGVVFNFVTLSAFHAQSEGMYNLATDFKEDGMLAYSRLQVGEQQSGGENDKHQFRAGTGLYDLVQQTLGITSTQALKGSTEEAQFSVNANAEGAVAEAI